MLHKDDQPCYILFRLDERDASESFFWTLIAWTPDDSPTRYPLSIPLCLNHVFLSDMGRHNFDVQTEGYWQAKNAVRLDKGHLQEAVWRRSSQRGLLCQP